MYIISSTPSSLTPHAVINLVLMFLQNKVNLPSYRYRSMEKNQTVRKHLKITGVGKMSKVTQGEPWNQFIWNVNIVGTLFRSIEISALCVGRKVAFKSDSFVWITILHKFFLCIICLWFPQMSVESWFYLSDEWEQINRRCLAVSISCTTAWTAW